MSKKLTTKEQLTEFLLYTDPNGDVKVEAFLHDENIWLSQKRMAELFGVTKPTISEHLTNIFKNGELVENSVVRKFRTTAEDGKTYEVKFYNLDAILSVGYRVNSKQATQFRIWASKILKEYIIKGFAMDDEKLKGVGGGTYWKELLERIRDIRSSEKVLYRQVLDLYATSIDYDAKSEETILFFETIQNKLHYAVNEQTAAEVIYSRADAEKEFMGLTTFTGEIPVKSEISIAKNYLNEDELFRLKRLVSAFFDLAEIKAQERKPMKMKDWIIELDKFSKTYGKGVLENSGKISHKKALEKAEKEYKKYQVKTLSPVEKDYLKVIKDTQKKLKNKNYE